MLYCHLGLILVHTIDLMRNSLNSLIFMYIQYPIHNVIHYESLSVIDNEYKRLMIHAYGKV